MIMNRKNFIYAFALYMAIVLPFFTGCKDDDDPTEDPVVPAEYIYVLNSGNSGSNNASLTMYDVKEGAVTGDIFEARNGRRLGDTGQDLIIYGSKMYISVYGESTIEVTDLEAKSVKQIRTEGQPRYFAVDGGKVYVTYYNGYVARIDTASLTVEAKVEVGRNPEQLTAVNGKLYVANSGGLDWNTETGYDRTVSVIDMATFTETKKIEVVVNPCNIVSDGNREIYLVSMGNYGSIPNTLQRIDGQTGEVSVVTDIQGTILANVGSTLYSVYAQWGAPQVMYYSYDMKEKKVLSDNFIGDTEISDVFYQISTDKTSGDIYITTSGEYPNTNDGDIYVFDKTEKFITKFEVGVFPMKAVRVTK
jgi:YVTN family beta-propeller protein